jgi:hypothetical protein
MCIFNLLSLFLHICIFYIDLFLYPTPSLFPLLFPTELKESFHIWNRGYQISIYGCSVSPDGWMTLADIFTYVLMYEMTTLDSATYSHRTKVKACQTGGFGLFHSLHKGII